MVLAAGLAGAAYFWREEIVNWWLKRQLAGELSRLLDAKVEMEDVHYRDGVLRTARCRVEGDKMPFASLEISEARLPFDWQRLKNPGKETLRIEAASVDLVWRDPSGDSPGNAAGSARSGAAAVPPIELVAANFSLRHENPELWRLVDSTAHINFEGGRWKFSGEGGALSVPGWPEFRVERLSGEHQGAETIISDFAFNDPKGGAVAGAASARGGRWSGDFRWKDVAMDLLLPPAAMKHFQGQSSGEANLADGVFKGRMRLDGSEVRNLPALVKLASIFTGEDYSTVRWESVQFDFIRDERGAVMVSDLAASSSKGLALRGSGAFSPDYLSADLQLGLKREGRPWLVAFMPILFRQEKEGFLWTPVKVGGTPAAPTEDLTTRVVAALAAAPATEAVETAAELPSTAVEAAGGLLRSLLGR